MVEIGTFALCGPFATCRIDILDGDRARATSMRIAFQAVRETFKG